MFNIKVENNTKENYVLQVGDILINEFGELCFVVEARSPQTHSLIYAISNVLRPQTFNATAVSLEILTDHAEYHNYKVFSQDKYDLVLRHKDIGAVG